MTPSVEQALFEKARSRLARIDGGPTSIAGPNLKVVKLNGRIEGLEVNPVLGGSGHRNRYFYDENEYDGIVFEGSGRHTTAIVQGSANSTVNIGRGRVFLKHMRLESSSRTLVSTSYAGGPPVWLDLEDIEAVVVPQKQGRTRWGFFLYNTDDTARDVDVYGDDLSEHCRYCHGHAEEGSVWRASRFHSAGAECDKTANRPQEGARWFPDQLILREDVRYAAWSRRGWGGGLVCQGTASNIVVRRCIFDSPPDVFSNALMVDDGYGQRSHHEARFFDTLTGAPQPKFYPDPSAVANGWVIGEELGVFGHGPEWFTELVRVGPLRPDVEHDTARGFLLRASAVYGSNTMVQLSRLTDDRAVISGCNTPALAATAESLGWDASEGAIRAFQGWRPLSEDYSSLVG